MKLGTMLEKLSALVTDENVPLDAEVQDYDIIHDMFFVISKIEVSEDKKSIILR